MQPLTKQELKEILASKQNKLAGKLLELIKSNTTDKLTKVTDLISLGCPDVYYKRDPSHPRSRYLIDYVLDSCFDNQEIIQPYPPTKMDTEEPPPYHEMVNIFKLLVTKKFKSGESTFRGNLNHHIMNSSLYYANPNSPKEVSKKNYATELAKILIKNKRIDINFYAGHSYLWVNSLENLEKILSLGAQPSGHNLIDCALSYINCSPSSNENPNDRIKVISKLLTLGSTAKEPLEKKISGTSIKKKLEEHGLLEQIQYQIDGQAIFDNIANKKINPILEPYT